MYNGKTWMVVVHTFHVKCFQPQHSYNLQYQINYKKRHFVFVDGCKIVTFVRIRCRHCRRLSLTSYRSALFLSYVGIWKSTVFLGVSDLVMKT